MVIIMIDTCRFLLSQVLGIIRIVLIAFHDKLSIFPHSSILLVHSELFNHRSLLCHAALISIAFTDKPYIIVHSSIALVHASLTETGSDYLDSLDSLDNRLDHINNIINNYYRENIQQPSGGANSKDLLKLPPGKQSLRQPMAAGTPKKQHKFTDILHF